ncbi:MAG: isoprenoid biosynthesis glyoxalase ElbB [Alphaproteobacteria bacterium]|nr:isoprenoid biosynthesis glyoxalase ElbB [Alphaproteobacteria bacterium]
MKVAVILSGCGVFDGSEIHEAVCTLLNLSKQGVEYQCFAPNKKQSKVINHLTREVEENEQRNILVEAARIARGNIKDLRDFNTIDFDAVIFPGGSGAINNLCDYGSKGANCRIDSDISKIISDCYECKMPIGAICIAPVLLAFVLGKYGITLTIGSNEQVIKAIEQTGAKHKKCSADNAVTDNKNLIVTTPAYMLATSIKETDAGISKLVSELIRLGREQNLS